jgi:hypothetical protein
MKSSSIEKMKSTGILALSSWQLFWHFAVVFLLLIPPIIVITDAVKYKIGNETQSINTFNRMAPVGYIPLILAIILYFVQKRRLKFKVVHLSVNHEAFLSAASATARKLDWEIIKKTNSIVVARSGLNWRSWGELITIIRDDDKILFNSICDPDNMTSIASWGRNSSNFSSFSDQLLQATSTEKDNLP